MAKKSPEPFLWLLFSAGGMVTALVAPVLLLLFGIAFPLGWVPPPEHAHLVVLLRHPLIRASLLVLCILALFHWAHRFHHMLRDGLQLKRSAYATAVACYSVAFLGSVAAGWIILGV